MNLVDLSTLRGLDAHRTYDTELEGRLDELDAEFVGIRMSEAARNEYASISDAQKEVRGTIAELEARAAAIQARAGSPKNTESGAFSVPNVRTSAENVFDLKGYRDRVRSVDDLPAAYRDGAMRAVEQASFPTTERAKGQGEVEKLINRDKTGEVARRVLVTGSPVYGRMIERYVTGGKDALTADELRAFQSGSSSDGGVALPFTIDPTFVLTTDGAVNPMRQISRVERITTKSYQTITTAGVSAGYVAETDPGTDAAPSDLDNPEVTPLRAHVWIPFTAEFAEDYGAALQGEIGTLIQDAKDVLEADAFINGTGTGEPEGIVWKIDDNTTKLVPTITNDVFALPDVDKLVGALGARFRARASFVANRAILQLIGTFGTAGQTAGTIYDSVSGKLRGYPSYESSEMSDSYGNQDEILLLGDFSKYLIVDRIGLAVEFVPQVFDGSGQPLGQRGIYARWRNSAAVQVLNAFRLLQVQ